MNTRRRERGPAASALLCFLLSLGMLLGPARIAQAQESTGTLLGQLVDPQGGVLPGVAVTLTNIKTGRITSAVTDGGGNYRADVEPGTYKVAFELSGFARQEMPDVNVFLGRTFTINATLKVGNLTEAVQVTAESAPLVDTRSTIIAHNVTAEEIDRMPKGRSFQSIAMTAPSVNSGDIEGGFQVNGASGSENQFTVDGVSTNSLLAGHSRQNTVFEYLQEVQVKTVGIPAEYGGALGGVISAVTKSGGNQFHGEGHYYFSGSSLSAGPVQRLVLSPVDERTVFTVQDDKQDDNRNEVGGSIGGPIVRDRLFFFGSLSPRFNARTNDYLFSSGTDPGEIKRDQTIMSGYGKVSYASRRVNAYFGALLTPTTSTGTLPAYTGTGPQFISSSKASNEVNKTRGYEQSQRSLTGNADINVSNSSFVSVKVGHFYDNYSDTGVPTTTPWYYETPCIAGSASCPSGFAGPRLTQNTPAVQIVDYDTTKQTYFQADYNASFTAAGYHTLKVGGGLRHNQNDVDQLYPGGRVLPLLGFGRYQYGAWRRNEQGHIRLLHSGRPRNLWRSGCQHLALLRAGPVERRQAHAESRLAPGRREDPRVQRPGRCDPFRMGREDRAQNWRGVRHVWRRPHEAVRQLWPLLRLDEVRSSRAGRSAAISGRPTTVRSTIRRSSTTSIWTICPAAICGAMPRAIRIIVSRASEPISSIRT